MYFGFITFERMETSLYLDLPSQSPLTLYHTTCPPTSFVSKLWFQKYVFFKYFRYLHFNHFLEQHNVTCELNILKASPSIWKWNAGVSIFRRECHFLPVLVSKPVPSHRLRQSYWTDFPSSSTELLNNGSTVSGWIAHKTVLGPKWNST